MSKEQLNNTEVELNEAIEANAEEQLTNEPIEGEVVNTEDVTTEVVPQVEEKKQNVFQRGLGFVKKHKVAFAAVGAAAATVAVGVAIAKHGEKDSLELIEDAEFVEKPIIPATDVEDIVTEDVNDTTEDLLEEIPE